MGLKWGFLFKGEEDGYFAHGFCCKCPLVTVGGVRRRLRVACHMGQDVASRGTTLNGIMSHRL